MKGACGKIMWENNLLICPYSEDDFEDYLDLECEDKLLQKFDRETNRESLEKELAESCVHLFSVFIMPEHKYCGKMELQTANENGNPEIGIALLKKFQNQGIGTEALKLFCSYCSQALGLKRVEARIDPENTRCIHVVDRIGARFTGKERKSIIWISSGHYIKSSTYRSRQI